MKTLGPLSLGPFACGNANDFIAGTLFISENTLAPIAGEIPTVHIVCLLRSSECLGRSHFAVCTPKYVSPYRWGASSWPFACGNTFDSRWDAICMGKYTGTYRWGDRHGAYCVYFT